MTQLKATIRHIEASDALHIVTLDFFGTPLVMMTLELNAEVKVGIEVRLAVKPTHIAIAKAFTGVLSYSNQLKATIADIENGTLLSSLRLRLLGNTVVESIMTRETSQRMELNAGDEVTVFIKASELSIMEVL